MKTTVRHMIVLCLFFLLAAGMISCNQKKDTPHGDTSGSSPSESVSAHEHTAGDWQTVQAATCTEAGIRCRACTICDEMMETKVVSALGHDLAHREEHPATCTSDGWTAYDSCTRCDYTTGFNVIPSLGHDNTHYEEKKVTCTENGWDAYDVCNRCQYSTYREISAMEHYMFSEFSKEPTCTEDGWEEYEACRVCGYENPPRKILPALGHDYSDDHICKRIQCTSIQKKIATWDITKPRSEGSKVKAELYEENGAYALYISGYGEMIGSDGEVDSEGILVAVPWKEYISSIIRVRIQNGVTNIGARMFSWHKNLRKVEIGEDLTVIEDAAFAECSSLTSIDMLSVRKFGHSVFQFCTSLEKVTFGYSVEEVGAGIFCGCINLKKINTSPGSRQFIAVGNCLIDMWNKRLVVGCKTSVIPTDGCVQEIADSAFSGCTELKSVTIPEGVTCIANGSFTGCTGLTAIHIPASVREIGIGAFYECSQIRSLTVAAGNSVYHSSGNCLIETATKTLVFGTANCEIPGDGSVQIIGSTAFAGNSQLTSVVIPEGVVTISQGAFEYCEALKSITLPKTLQYIGDFAFNGCNALTDVYYSGSAAEWSAITVCALNEPLQKAKRHDV